MRAKCHNWHACMVVENGRKQVQLHAAHPACSWLHFAGMSNTHPGVPRHSRGCYGETTCSHAQEAPVTSRKATTLPAHLTCLPGRAAWGVLSSAPHVQDLLLVAVVAPSDLELASWSPLVRTMYYCAVGTRAGFLPSERSTRDRSPESHALLHVIHHAIWRHTLRQS
jgi:hypothetical protein